MAAISIKRRIDRWIGGPRELIEQTSTAESVDRITQRVQESKEPTEEISVEPNEPELDQGHIESVGIEEYDDEAEEEDWRSYTSDNILDIDWRWRWHGTSIESLIALCPECELELLELTRPFSNAGYDNREWLMGLKCQDEECQFEHNPNAETVHEYHDIIKKHIRRNAHEMGLPA